MSSTPKKTSQEQDEQFARWSSQHSMDSRQVRFVKEAIETHVGRQDFSLVDVGGGSGVFADLILEMFPGATVTILDTSQYLLDQNTDRGERKSLVCGDAARMAEVLEGRRFDVVMFNHVIHHFVGADYRATLALQTEIMRQVPRIVTDDGVAVVIENPYEGALMRDAPGYLIFRLTSLDNVLTPVIRKLGANTAGTGVAFHSDTLWTRCFDEAGLEVAERTLIEDRSANVHRLKRLALHIRGMNLTGYVLRPASQR